MLRKIFMFSFCVFGMACGGAGAPTAPTPVRSFNQNISGTVSSFGSVQHPLTVSKSGNMSLTLSWNTSADLDLYLTASSCNVYPPGACQLLAVSDGSTSPERITRPVTSGESFKVWVDSFSSAPQAYTLSIAIP